MAQRELQTLDIYGNEGGGVNRRRIDGVVAEVDIAFLRLGVVPLDLAGRAFVLEMQVQGVKIQSGPDPQSTPEQLLERA